MSKLTVRIVPILVLLLLTVNQKASAQGFSAYFGVGTAQDEPTSDPACPGPRQLTDFVTGNCEDSAPMGGPFGVFGGDFMVTPHIGVNGEYSFHFVQARYLPIGGLTARPEFYDFNAVFEPVSGDGRVIPVVEAGIGGARLPVYFNASQCVTPTVCQSFTQTIASVNHFQVHGAFGIKLYVTPTVFLKPQFDARWIDHWNQQYGNTFVPEYSMAIGVTFGRH